MTEEKEKPKPNPDMYRYGVVGSKFLEAGDHNSAGKCLEKLSKEMKVPKEYERFMVWNAPAENLEAKLFDMKRGFSIAQGLYDEELGKFTISEMYERYSPEFEKYLSEDERAKAKEAFETLGSETYASISEKVAVLKHDMNVSKEELESSKALREKAEKAKKEYEKKYASIDSTIQAFESLRLKKLIDPMQEDSIKSMLKERFKVEEKEEKK